MSHDEVCTSRVSAWGPPRSRRRRAWATGVAAGALALAPLASSVASAMTSPMVKSANVAGYRGALVTSSSKTLYLLSSERGAKIKCSAGCLSIWPPLLVKKSVTKVSLGANVRGRISFVSRSKTMKQVTFNSFPLYTYSGDHGKLEHNGAGIVAFGGTWYLVKSSATTPAASLFKAVVTASKPTGSTTTTTKSGWSSGGY